MKNFEDLKGKTLKAISGGINDNTMVFTLETGVQCRLYHDQDCCERVYILDIAGNVNDLLDSPILLAEEVTFYQENPENVVAPEYQDSFTWTFYKLSTIKGSVTIRWYGESNGYYSERVTFHTLNEETL